MWPVPIYNNGYMSHTAKNAKKSSGPVWFVVKLVPGKAAIPVKTKLTKKEAIALMASLPSS